MAKTYRRTQNGPVMLLMSEFNPLGGVQIELNASVGQVDFIQPSGLLDQRGKCMEA